MNTGQTLSVECLIIGGGPAGLTAAEYLARFRRSVMLVDRGGSRAELIASSHNYPGFSSGVSGERLLAELRAQATRYGASIHHGTVETLEREGEKFRATVKDREIVAHKVVLATGIIDEKPALPSLPEFIYRGGVRFCPICDGFEAMDKRIAVVGPLTKAVKKALFLRTYSRSVTVLPLGRDKHPDGQDRSALQQAGITLPTEPLADLDTEGTIIKATLASGASIEIEVLYPAMGALVRSELATGVGANANDMGCLIVDAHMSTSVPGLYAVGDVTHDLDQISVATGQAAIAATHIHNTLPANYR